MPKNNSRTWIAWLATAMFFFYSFFNRMLIGTIAPNLVQTLKISLPEIGALVASLYFVLALLQIPAGIILDRYPLKYVLSLTALIASIGSLIFSFASTFPVAIFARIIIAIGTSFAFIGCLKANALFFKKQSLSIASGLTLLVGALGAITAETPVEWFTTYFSLHALFLAITGVGFTICLLLFLTLPKASSQETTKEITFSFKKIVTPTNMVLAIFCACMTLPSSIFLAVWGDNYLALAFHLEREIATEIIVAAFVGLIVGSIIINFSIGIIRYRLIILILCGLLGIATSVLLLYLTYANELTLSVLLFIFGLISAALMVAFTYTAERNPIANIGAINGFINGFTMLISGIGQFLTGFTIQYFHRYFEIVESYKLTLLCLPVFFAIAIFAVIRLRRHLVTS